MSAQSLAEVAKKEKGRRGGTARTGGTGTHEPVPVIGDEELSSARGDTLSVTGTPEPTKPTKPTKKAPSEPDPSSADSGERLLTEAEIRDYRETWARVWPERLAAAEKELELAIDAAFQCQSAAHYVFVPLAVDCYGVFERRAIAEYRLRETRRNRYNWELLLPERPRPPPPQ